MIVRFSQVLALVLLVATIIQAKPRRLAPSWPLWESYKHRFVSTDGRVIDWHANGRTTSEGQAYALFFALVADDRDTFEQVLGWTQSNLARGDLRAQLPSWLWEPTSQGRGVVTDGNSASDADLWIAYTLISAGRAWNIPQHISLGRSMAERILATEVASDTYLRAILLPGPTGFRPDADTFIVNPSYLPPQLLYALQSEAPRQPWSILADNLAYMLSESVGNGFAMDWAAFHEDSGFTAAPGPNSSAHGSYDAIRVYLWIGMLDPQSPQRPQLLQALYGMPAYLQTHNFPPESIAPDGKILSTQGPVGFSAAVIPFLLASDHPQLAQVQQLRLKKEFSSVTGLYGKEPTYYDQNLILFSEGLMDQRFRFSHDGRLCLRWNQ